MWPKRVWIRVAVVSVSLFLCSATGCHEEQARQVGDTIQNAQQAVDTVVSDPNGPVQQFAGQAQSLLEKGEPLVQIIEKTPWGYPVSMGYAAIMSVLGLILKLRKDKVVTALKEVVVGVQASRETLPVESKAVTTRASNIAQSVTTQAIVSEIKSDPAIQQTVAGIVKAVS